jgi:ribosomal-protein-alanine N-acetyltransferase
MEWTVRPYRETDFPAVWALERVRDIEGYASAVTIRQAAALWPATILVADEDGEAVGFTIGAASSDPAAGWVLRLKVCEDRRRRGYATTLLLSVFGRLRDGGVRTVRLTVAPENRPARALYEGLGFFEEAMLPDYFGPGEDRLLLCRPIDIAPLAAPDGTKGLERPGA